MAATEDDVKIERHKRMLETIRRKRQEVDDGTSRQLGAGVSSGYAESRTSSDGANTPGGDGLAKRDEGREKRAGETNGASERLREGVRPADRPTVNADKSTGNGSRRPKGEEPTKRLDETEKRLNFQLRNPFHGRSPQEPVKLFSKEEAEAEYDKMYEIYFRGSGLLDDILEISVKGHESVQIWQLDEEEARTLAEMHLARARYDKRSAASARQLLALYDRLYFWILAGPRLKVTASHVKEHGGFSFR